MLMWVWVEWLHIDVGLGRMAPYLRGFGQNSSILSGYWVIWLDTEAVMALVLGAEAAVQSVIESNPTRPLPPGAAIVVKDAKAGRCCEPALHPR
jgi:hypothetical protein